MDKNVQMQEKSASQVFTDEQPTLEVTLAEFDAMVLKKQRFDRLMENEDFVALIKEDYLEEDFNRNVGLLKVYKNKNVVAARPKIIERIFAKTHLEEWLEQIRVTLDGIDNPEQRIELVNQLEAQLAAQEAEDRLEGEDNE